MTAIDPDPAPSYDQAEQAAETYGPGPYEHTGQYVDGEFFDTTGIPPGFCEDCGHAPCVAGGRTFCSMRPRAIVSRAVRREIYDLIDRSQIESPLRPVLHEALFVLSAAASGPDIWSQTALESLAGLRDMVRELVES